MVLSMLLHWFALAALVGFVCCIRMLAAFVSLALWDRLGALAALLLHPTSQVWQSRRTVQE